MSIDETRARDELAKVIRGVDWSPEAGGYAVPFADAILDPVVFARVAGLLGYVKAEAARTLGDSLVRWQTAAVEATHSHDLINDDGDGDWMAVYERLVSLSDSHVKVDSWAWGVYHPEGDYTDLYDDEATAREMQEANGGQLVRTPQCDWEVVSDAE